VGVGGHYRNRVDCIYSDSGLGRLSGERALWLAKSFHIEPYDSGFKARLRKSGSLFDRPELPYSENKTQREQMIAEAKAIVDTLR
jgi:hypothetical protein